MRDLFTITLAALVSLGAGFSLGFDSTVAAAEFDGPVRGVWVANVGSSALGSAEKVREFVSLAEFCKLNTLYVVVWNRGMTTYPSEVMSKRFGITVDPRYAQFDMLDEIVHAAHERDMRVIAWFEFGFSCSYQQPDGGHIIAENPHWAARDSAGKIATKNGFQWMNAFHPEVQDFVLELLQEILSKYQVDGVQGDDRLPACPSTSGYDEWTKKLYKSQHNGKSPPADHLAGEWIDWRADRLNRFMKRMHGELKSTHPDRVLSVAPSIYPWSKKNYLQDWPTWLASGWVDEVCPQVYRDNLDSYRAELGKISTQQVSKENLRRVYPGVLVRTASKRYNDGPSIRAMVDANREHGFRGEVYFYDAALSEYAELFAELYD
ncbi:MAG: family 10 glycosylhydrolase [Planctomycetota bacterium]